MSSLAGSGRIDSMDQFRGYTVAGMFVVNFLGSMTAIHSVMKHNNSYFSYADTIMPSFLFACGFAYRLTYLRRLDQLGLAATRWMIVKRSLSLILLSLVVFGFGGSFSSFEEMTGEAIREFVARLLKANLWEVLAIIGATQVLILPIIGSRPGIRALAIAVLGLTHVLISYWFNYDFVHGRPSVLDDYWGVSKTRAWDGGAFGLLMWSIPMLAGSLAYDCWTRSGPARAWRSLLGCGIVLMVIGYGFSCLTRLYDGPAGSSPGVVASPVLASLANVQGRPFTALLAEPPFVAPPAERPANYWRMDKRIVSLSFILFSTGFSSALFALFVLGCDLGTIQVAVFRVLGRNALAAYVIHHIVEHTMHDIVPKDSPLWWCLVSLSIFLFLTYQFVRYFDRSKIFIRL